MSTESAKLTAMDPNAKLGWLERISYGLGDYAGNLVYSSISAFLLVYYVSVLGMDSAVAASIMAVSKIFDGVSDLIMGRIIDKTKSKWGKARPWILRMSIPLAICTVLMFSVPASLTGRMQVGYAFITYNLVSTVFYTGLNVPYATMQGLMTTNQYERGLLGNFRMMLATFGTMTVNSVVMKLCAYFGGGDQYAQRGWTITFIIMMIAFFAINLLTFLFCKERVVQEAASTESGEAVKGPSVIECLKSLVKNKYWILIVIMMFVMYFMMSTFFGSNYYFAQYVMNNEGAYPILSNSLSMAQMGFMFVTPFIMLKLSKRWLALIGMSLSAVGFALTSLAGQSVAMVVACNIIKGIGFGCAGATMFGVLQDAITYGQWKTGVQAAGMGNAASSFCMKVGSGIGTAALGWILSAGGFDADPTSASAVASINVACIWVPVITSLIAIACLFFMDIDKHYDKAMADLREGKWEKGTL